MVTFGQNLATVLTYLGFIHTEQKRLHSLHGLEKVTRMSKFFTEFCFT